jgi:Domain of unknown function (DUF4357)
LVDGTPQGLRVVDRIGRTGACLAFTRAEYGQARGRKELARTGVYVLLGPEDKDRRPQRVYIGEGDELRTRLDAHQREKDFWTHGYVLTTKDDSLNKAHVRYIESRLIAMAVEADAAILDNGTAPPPPRLGESEEADMEAYLEDALVLLPLVGVNVFEVVTPSGSTQVDTSSGASVPLEGNTYRLGSPLTDATGRDDARGFAVLEGGLGRLEEKVMTDGYRALRHRLIEDGILVPHSENQVRLTRTYVFDSPSSAASVMAGGSMNGREEWRDDRGRTLKENQVAAAAG